MSAEPTPRVHGRAFYLERIRMPPGTVHTARVHADDAERTELGVAAFVDAAGPPYEFDVSLDAAAVQAAPPGAGALLSCSCATRPECWSSPRRSRFWRPPAGNRSSSGSSARSGRTDRYLLG
jgi:hypothetical protein